MPMRIKRLARPCDGSVRRLASLVAVLLVAWCNPARAGSECADPAPAHLAATPDASPAPCAPFDPVTFVGPPVPLAILFAPATPPAMGGLRYEIEGARSAAPVGGPRPVARTGLRMVWDPEVQAQLREVPAPGGGYMVDLLGAYLDLAILTIGDDGRPVLECAQQPRTRTRAGRE